MNSQPNHSSPEDIEFFSLTHALIRFRQRLEAEAAEPISAIEANAALLLFDFCEFLGLGAAQRNRILGPHGAGYLATTQSTRVEVPELH